ncbi:hypothetical protein HW555_006963 [Spodoptera exigua]|nr:hypothetical protein HW555_006963 [Spodoptera exigua]
MDEKNPLQISKTPSKLPDSREVNKRGRPAVKNIVMFGPEPRSIVSQMLSEAKKAKQTLISEDKPVKQLKQEQKSQDVVEVIVS